MNLQAHKRFKWYMEIKVINLMPYLFSNNVEKNEPAGSQEV